MNFDAATSARGGDRAALAVHLRDSRVRTLALLDAYVAALGEALVVPYSLQLNPPLAALALLPWLLKPLLRRLRPATQ